MESDVRYFHELLVRYGFLDTGSTVPAKPVPTRPQEQRIPAWASLLG